MSLLSVPEAHEKILSQIKPLGTEFVPITAASNRVLAGDIISADDLPHFDNSSMDGFAVIAADTSDAVPASPLTLRVVADIPAGSNPTVLLRSGETARIMTGAHMPAGANAVIPVEDTDFNERSPGTPAPEFIQIQKSIKGGENVRPRGLDIRAGEVAIKKGVLLRPQDIGVLAMIGQAEVEVFKRPHIALLSSGDELTETGAVLEPGKIRDSNSYMLASLIESAHANVLRLGVAKDSYDSIFALVEDAVRQNVDLIISSAGVSVGAFDYIKDVIESNGRLNFWRVNMRPGKPFAFGNYKDIPFIGLPGNPVSAFVGFEVFVRDAIGHMAGLEEIGRPKIRVRCDEEILSDGRESYLRAVVHEKDGVYIAKLAGHQGSGNLLSLVQGNALLIIPAGVKCVPAGQEVYGWIL